MSKDSIVLVQTPHEAKAEGVKPSAICISLEQVYSVQYDHDGPNGCLRKHVTTALGTFVYLRLGAQWESVDFPHGTC